MMFLITCLTAKGSPPLVAVASWQLVLVVLVGGIAAYSWYRLWQYARGTTLVASTFWGMAATLGVLLVAYSMARDPLPLGGAERANLRYLTAALLFCPLMAVLGARRPHHLAWQWIVISFLAIVILPVAESYVVQRGAAVKIHDARCYFLAVMILANLANYLPTRFAWSASCLAAAQAVLLSEHIPLWRRAAGSNDELIAVGLLGAAFLLGWTRRRLPAALPGPTRAWLDYRDAFGAIWALRMQDRMNTYGENYRWPVRLRWRGFVQVDGGRVTELSPDVQQSWQSLLRRFVS